MMSERMLAAEKLIDVLLGVTCNTDVAGSAHPASADGAPGDRGCVASSSQAATGMLQDPPTLIRRRSVSTKKAKQSSAPSLPAVEPPEAKLTRPGPVPMLEDEDLRRNLLALLRAGFSRRLAAFELNLHPSTVSRTIKRDPKFAEEVLRAEEQFTRAPILCLLQAARKNWRAAAWVMKNYQPHDSVTRRNDRRETKLFMKKKRDLYAAMEEKQGEDRRLR